ncbi:unnamed protein product [Brassicogethes aeneus]|uniref:Uncharacterized protein n=1 Tax=Brassicogethes aeneus TaxID=1431903 RepID=A0A9P0BE93_BRAAE|nr:unnamed protein product [Brassicogethes aeneus]
MNLLTFAIALTFFVTYCTTNEVTELIKRAQNTCRIRTGLSEDKLNQAIEAKTKDEIPKGKDIECFIECIWVEFGVLDPNTGVYDEQNFIESNPKEFVELWLNISRPCHITNFTSNDFCKEAYNYYVYCLFEQPNFYFI